MNENYGQINNQMPMGGPAPMNGQPPMGGSAPVYGSAPMGGPAPMNGQPPMGGPAPMYGQPPMGGPAPVYGQPPMGGSAPMYGSAPMGGPAPVYGSAPMGGPAPMYGQPPMGGPAPMYGQPPMGGPAPAINPGFVAPPPVPFQGMEKREHIKTQEEMKNDEDVEKRVKRMMSSPFTLAFAITVSVQILCIIVSSFMKVGIIGMAYIVPYTLMCVSAWIIWGTSRKDKYVAAGPILIVVQSILNILSMSAWISFFVFLSLLGALAPEEFSELFDLILYNFFSLHSNFRALGYGSVWVFFLLGIIPMALYIVLQARLIGFASVISNAIKHKSKQPHTMFTAVLMFIFVVLSGVITGIYINMISRSIIFIGNILVVVALALNVGLFGIMGWQMLVLRKKHDDWDEE